MGKQKRKGGTAAPFRRGANDHLSGAEAERFWRMVDEGVPAPELAREFNLSKQAVSRRIRKSGKKVPPASGGRPAAPKNIDKGPQVRREVRADGSCELEVNSLTVRTLEEALRVAEVDLEQSEVVRHVINSWGVTMKVQQPDGTQKVEYRTNYQVKVWLRPRIKPLVGEAIEALCRMLPEYRGKPCRAIGKPDGGVWVEVDIMDPHFGKLCWAPETGQDYDLKSARHLYRDTVQRLADRAGRFDVELITLLIGNDFLEVDNPQGLTPAHGNQLDTDSRLPKIFATAMLSVIEAVDFLSGIAPVEVVWVPGNHDPMTGYFLCVALHQRFRTHKRVHVDTSPMARKYKLWGRNLVGWTHGVWERHDDLPTIMATEQPQLFAASDWREWHLGHFHRKKERVYNAADTFNGVVVRILPGLTGVDAYHYTRGYSKPVRAGEAFVWHKTEGLIGLYTARA